MGPSRISPQLPSDDDSSSDGSRTSDGSRSSSDQEVEQPRAAKPLPLAPAQKVNGGSDDETDSDTEGEEEGSDKEMGETGEATKDLPPLPPPPPPPPQGNQGADKVADSQSGSEPESDSGEDEESDSESDEAPPKPTEKPQPAKKAPQAEVTKKPPPKGKRKAPQVQLANPSQKKKKMEPTHLPQLNVNTLPVHVAAPGQGQNNVAPGQGQNNVAPGQGQNNVDNLFQVKCETYMFLGMEVSALEAKQPGMFKVPFLKLTDEKANTLNIKVKKQVLAEVKARLRRGDIEKEVTNTLLNMLK